jgi:hypothetical protein
MPRKKTRARPTCRPNARTMSFLASVSPHRRQGDFPTRILGSRRTDARARHVNGRGYGPRSLCDLALVLLATATGVLARRVDRGALARLAPDRYQADDPVWRHQGLFATRVCLPRLARSSQLAAAAAAVFGESPGSSGYQCGDDSLGHGDAPRECERVEAAGGGPESSTPRCARVAETFDDFCCCCAGGLDSDVDASSISGGGGA